MRAARLIAPALLLAASVAHATPAHAWANVTYYGQATIHDGFSVKSDDNVPDPSQPDGSLFPDSYSQADGSTLFLRDHVDPKRDDSFMLSPVGPRYFTINWGGFSGGSAACLRDGDETVYSNRISVSGPGWAAGGVAAANAVANVTCVVDTTRYLFEYAKGAVQVSGPGNGSWTLSSGGPATVSTLNSRGKWVAIASAQPVTFSVSFTGTPG